MNVALGPAVGTDYLDRVAQQHWGYPEVLVRIAEDPRAGEDTLVALAAHPQFHTVAAVAAKRLEKMGVLLRGTHSLAE